jgi:hypothetical protein
MTNSELQELCLSLMRADTEEEIVTLLTAAGFWNKPGRWRYIGDTENNYSQVGNQQAEPIASLAEKLVNSIDARVTNACLMAGIDPTSDDAPKSVRAAVGRFYGDGADRNGQIVNWGKAKTLAESLLITVAATGHKPETGSPSITIADAGEGQEPDAQPDTFMSINRSNKLRIACVQGKYNMGGLGALNFCDTTNRFQLVVSRRNPALLSAGASTRAHQWVFTIVRREPPLGNQKHASFTYLAPEGATERDGGVLAFDADQWPIFPVDDATGHDAYSRMADFGSLVKLYEYKWKGSKSNIITSGDGLLRRLDQALPELALPVRLYECRDYGGHTGSYSNNLTGLTVRLDLDRADNLDDSIENPRRSSIDIDGQRIKVRVFVFKKGRAKNYRRDRSAIIMVVNGQTHATFSKDFFTRKNVKLGYLADEMLVVLDCSDLSGMTRDDLFMNSRDRVKETEISERIMDELEDLLKRDEGLRELQNRRRKEEMEERLSDNQPLADAFKDILKSDPTLERLFLTGTSIPTPFSRQGSGEGTGGQFVGKSYPSYWRFRNKVQGEELRRTAHHGSSPRVEFETDVDNTYFDRSDNPDFHEGEWRVFRKDVDPPVAIPGCRMDGPREGIAILHLTLPADVGVGDELPLEVEVGDDTMVEPFVNRLTLRIIAPGGGGGGNGGSASSNRGRGDRGGNSNLTLPEVIPVKESEWGTHEFTENDALRVVRTSGDDDRDQLDFYVNVDNKHLKTTQKNAKKDTNLVLLERQFMYANVLIGMALLNAEKAAPGPDDADDTEKDGTGTEDRIRRLTAALAPVILPMVDVLSSLSIEDAISG